jgi:mitochondrial fusion and transport protein UGO1
MGDTGVDVSLILSSLLASAALQYASTALAMPWEVGKLLLQVQWVPRDAGEPEPVTEKAEDEDEEVCIVVILHSYILVDSTSGLS